VQGGGKGDSEEDDNEDDDSGDMKEDEEEESIEEGTAVQARILVRPTMYRSPRKKVARRRRRPR